MDNFHFHDFFPEIITEVQCAMVDLPPNPFIEEYIKNIPQDCVYNEPGYGKETEPHITVFYGIEASAEEKAKKILRQVPRNISATLGKTSKFSVESKPYDVLKIDVTSPQLTRIHYLIKNNCETNSEFPSYHPHVTLAYVKKGTCQERVGDNRFNGLRFRFNAFTYNNGITKDAQPVLMKEYSVGTGGGYGGAAGGSVAASGWAGTYSSPQTSRRLKDYSGTNGHSYMNGNTIVANSLYDTITKDDLTGTPYSPDDIFSGLRYEMQRMEYPDKDKARVVVIKNLSKDPHFYSDLKQYFDSDKL